MKQLFQIRKEKPEDGLQPVLAIRIGEHFVSYAVASAETASLFHLQYFYFEKQSELFEIIETDLPKSDDQFSKVIIALDYAQNMLIPQALFQKEKAANFLQQLHGLHKDAVILQDQIDGQIVNVYAASAELHLALKTKYESASFKNQFTVLANQQHTIAKEGAFYIDFRKDDFSIIILANNNIVFTQIFSYTKPEDVLFYILKICKQFSFLQDEVKVWLSGLIDDDSALYKEIYLYFVHVNFRQPNWNGADEYPAHYFTGLNDLLQCE